MCVQFGRRFEGQPVDRLSRTYCMYKCGNKDDCRTDESYDCYSPATFGGGKGMEEAEVLGSDSMFCAQIPLKTATEPPSTAKTVPTGGPDAGPTGD